MINVLMIGTLATFVAYSLWYFFKAKTFQPLTLDNLALTWKIHKQQTKCKAAHINTLLVRNNEVVGFKCECGHDYLQKRLITQKIHTYTKTSIAPLISPKISNLLETKASLENLGLSYSTIKEI